MPTVNPDTATSQHQNVLVRPTEGDEVGFSTGATLLWRRTAGGVEIAHPFTEFTISDSVMVSSLSELVELGVLHGQTQFEDAAVQLICSSAPTKAAAWRAYYENSINELADGTSFQSGPLAGPVVDRR